MRHLIAKRNRVRDMLTELENDRYAYFSDKQLREVIDDDNFAFLLAEREQLDEMRQARELKENGTLDERQALPGVYAFQAKLLETQKYTTGRINKIEYWEKQRKEAEKFLAIHTNAVLDMFEDTQRLWGNLSPREQAAFGRPKPNPVDVFDYSSHVNSEKALHYPEPTGRHITATTKLRHILEWLDAEIAKEGGQ